MDRRYTFSDFVQIIKALRAEGGCPWDREQTHESLRPCMTEEAAELLASIRIYEKTGNADNMCEELGDILLQVVMHSVIAQEEGLFSVDDVIREVAEKMIRRHPHVFGTAEAENSAQVLENWEEIKKKEKEKRSFQITPLREIPQELPALARACKVIKKVDKLYGLPEQADSLPGRLGEGMARLQRADEAGDAETVREAYTDLLWMLGEFAYRRKLNPEQDLSDRIAEKVEFFEPESE